MRTGYILKKSYTHLSLQPRFPFLKDPDKIFQAPVISFFNVIRKITGRQFAHASVIVQAIAANALSAARIGTIAAVRVSVFFAVHDPNVSYLMENLRLSGGRKSRSPFPAGKVDLSGLPG
jgi:hypothetical protein